MAYTKKLISSHVRQAGIPYALRQEVTNQILQVLRYLRLNSKISRYQYCPKTRKKLGMRILDRSRGRPHLKMERTYLISTLFRVWVRAFGKRPRINRRGEYDTPFVMFAEKILRSVGIFNALDNLNQYRAYYNRLSRIIDRRGSVFVQMN